MMKQTRCTGERHDQEHDFTRSIPRQPASTSPQMLTPSRYGAGVPCGTFSPLTSRPCVLAMRNVQRAGWGTASRQAAAHAVASQQSAMCPAPGRALHARRLSCRPGPSTSCQKCDPQNLSHRPSAAAAQPQRRRGGQARICARGLGRAPRGCPQRPAGRAARSEAEVGRRIHRPEELGQQALVEHLRACTHVAGPGPACAAGVA